MTVTVTIREAVSNNHTAQVNLNANKNGTTNAAVTDRQNTQSNRQTLDSTEHEQSGLYTNVDISGSGGSSESSGGTSNGNGKRYLLQTDIYLITLQTDYSEQELTAYFDLDKGCQNFEQSLD